MVVARHQHRPAGVPAIHAGNAPRRVQGLRDAQVEPLHAPRPAPQRAQPLEARMCRQHPRGPGVDRGLVCRPCRGRGGVHHIQIGEKAVCLAAQLAAPLAARPIVHLAGRPCCRTRPDPVDTAMQGQRTQAALGLVAERHRAQILASRAKHIERRVRVAAVHRPREPADAAPGAEAMAVAQHGDGLVERRTSGVHPFLRYRPGADAREPGRSGRGVMRLGSARTQRAEHRARLHRGELVLVAEQHQARTGRHGREHRRHHLQIHHRGLVDHQHIQRQRVPGVVTEVTRIRAAAEQPVQGADPGRDRGPHPLAIWETVQRQRRHRARDRRIEPRCRLAGRCGEADAQRAGRHAALRCRLQRQRLERGQKTHHGGGLAGARPAGDDAEIAACGERTGTLLPVHVCAVGREQCSEHVAQRLLGQGVGVRDALQPGADAGAHRLLVLPEATQIQPRAHAHQRRGTRPGADQRGAVERCEPGRERHAA